MSQDRDYLLKPIGRPLHAVAIDVCQKHRVSAQELLSSRRLKAFVLARQEFCWRARRETEASLPEIGKFIGRDHTTVIHSIERHEQRVAAPPLR